MLSKSKVQPAKNRVLSVLRWESYKVTGSINTVRCGRVVRCGEDGGGPGQRGQVHRLRGGTGSLGGNGTVTGPMTGFLGDRLDRFGDPGA